MKKLILASALVILCVFGLNAADLGDAAEPLDIQDWVKGSAVEVAPGKGTNIHVVEFWATWCPPCRTSIPHLTDLQKKFKDKGVVIIGVSDEKTDVVKKFVDKMGDKMDYTVAVDAGKTSERYMQAFGVGGIPHAFIVKDGKIIWHGHPMGELEETLQQVVEGKYDMSTAKKRADAGEKLREYIQLTVSGDDPEKAKQLEADLVALENEVGNIMNGEKFDPADVQKRVKFGQKFMKYQQLLVGGANAGELATLEKELEAEAPEGFDLKKVKAEMQKSIAQRKEAQQVQQLFSDYAGTVGDDGNPAKAAELARQLESLETTNAEMLNGIAWTILTDDRIKSRDTELALKLAKRAVDVTEGKDASVLETYARALFESGKTAEAIAQQKKAIELAEDDDEKAELKESLAKYEAKAGQTK